jgi:hypothetical protein
MCPTHTDTAELQTRVNALSLEQKVRLLSGADFWSLYPERAAGLLRRLVVSDGARDGAVEPGEGQGSMKASRPGRPRARP